MVAASDYGLSAENTAADNGDALTAAASAAGSGGAVTVAAGTYDCIGAVLPTRITLSLADSATLRHPDGTTGTAVVRTSRTDVTGTGTADSHQIVLSDVSGVEVGVPVMVYGAGPLLDGSHKVLYTYVAELSGTTAVLVDPLQADVTDATVTVGTQSVVIEGGTIDGRRQATDQGSNPHPILFQTVRNGRVDGTAIHSGDHAAVFMRQGCIGCVVDGADLSDCGQPDASLGALVWMFQGCRENVVRSSTLGGDSYHGVVIDDRSTGDEDETGQCDDNRVERTTITLPRYSGNSGLVVNGSRGNKFRAVDVSGSQSGGSVVTGQGSSRDVTQNVFGGCTFDDHLIGVMLDEDGNTVDSCEFTNCGTDVDDRSGSNTVLTGSTVAQYRQSRPERTIDPSGLLLLRR